LVENVIWAENVSTPSYGRRESKIVQKKRHVIFERSLRRFSIAHVNAALSKDKFMSYDL